jgi:hypothetical protein
MPLDPAKLYTIAPVEPSQGTGNPARVHSFAQTGAPLPLHWLDPFSLEQPGIAQCFERAHTGRQIGFFKGKGLSTRRPPDPLRQPDGVPFYAKMAEQDG